jgi:KUP system potassium uptake protein
MNSTAKNSLRFSVPGLIITLGIVYGDIGTSPLYVINAITMALSSYKPEMIYGAISLVIWTLTLLTTIKYILITLRADNKGEGGVFSLFALIRRRVPKAYILAIIGGSALLADGIITPSITVTSAIEGLQMVDPGLPVVPIVLGIITVLFMFQQFGTQKLGRSFGPIMVVWFGMLGFLGLIQIVKCPTILHAFNPMYAIMLLKNHPGGFFIMGAVFLATTGAEALYSDMGHVGRKNIQVSWIYVKMALILNYLGQGAWLIMNHDHYHKGDSIFYSIMPSWFLIPGIIIATAAAIIASQALISGSFTLISEAISMNFWPKMKLKYPTEIKGQVYIPTINWVLWIGCMFVVLYFGDSTKMEAAYGLAITITMLTTTMLLSVYLRHYSIPRMAIFLFLLIFGSIEITFLCANLSKFVHGGWFTIVMASVFWLIMYTWYNGRKIKNKFLVFVHISDYLPMLKDMVNDITIPKFATNLVYITRANKINEVESKIIYSVMNKQPKRADVYWFLHVDVLDEPNTFEYEVSVFEEGKVYKVDFRLGFKIETKVSTYFRQVLEDMEKNSEIDLISRYPSLRQHDVMSDFQYVLIDRVVNQDNNFSFHQKFVMTLYNIFRKIGISDMKAWGLDTNNVIVELVPLIMEQKSKRRIHRRNIHTVKSSH